MCVTQWLHLYPRICLCVLDLLCPPARTFLGQVYLFLAGDRQTHLDVYLCPDGSWRGGRRCDIPLGRQSHSESVDIIHSPSLKEVQWGGCNKQRQNNTFNGKLCIIVKEAVSAFQHLTNCPFHLSSHLLYVCGVAPTEHRIPRSQCQHLISTICKWTGTVPEGQSTNWRQNNSNSESLCVCVWGLKTCCGSRLLACVSLWWTIVD